MVIKKGVKIFDPVLDGDIGFNQDSPAPRLASFFCARSAGDKNIVFFLIMGLAPKQRLADYLPGFGVGLGDIADLQFLNLCWWDIYRAISIGQGHFEMNARTHEPDFACASFGIAEMLNYRLFIRINNNNAAQQIKRQRRRKTRGTIAFSRSL